MTQNNKAKSKPLTLGQILERMAALRLSTCMCYDAAQSLLERISDIDEEVRGLLMELEDQEYVKS